MKLEGSASTEIAAPADQLWSMVTDVTRMGQWSPETYTGRWLGRPGPSVGARFQGCNRLTWVGTWCSTATITECDPPRSFSFVVGKNTERPNTEWSYSFEPSSEGTTTVTERYRMIREPLVVRSYYRLIRRDRQLAAGVAETLRRLKKAAESPATEPSLAADRATPLTASRTQPASPPDLARPPVHHPVFARLYGRFSPASEAKGAGVHRQTLLAGLAGDVIEIGCGNGLNFKHYPPTVTNVVAVEPEAYLRVLAQTAAVDASSPTTVRVVDGRAEALPVPDVTFDAAVVSLVLCSVADPAQVLAEIRRVLRPGGELRFYEHVQAGSDPLRRLQRLAAPVWRAIAGGCRPDRDTTASIESAGFRIERIDRFDFRPGPLVPLGLMAPHILGTARKVSTVMDG